MKTILAGLLCLFGTVISAQTPAQTKAFYGAGHTSYSVTLDQPTVKGQAIILELYVPGALWQPGPVCKLAAGFCDYNLYDSQGNQFMQINRDYPSLLYVPASKGGTETITVVYANARGPQSIIVVALVFPDTLVLQDVVTPRCDFLPQVGQQGICNPWNSANSTLGTDDSAVISSHPLTSSVPNELFVGFGNVNPGIQTLIPSVGWAVPIGAAGTFLSYATSASVGTSMIFTLSLSPSLLEGQYGYMGLNGFKVIPIQ